MEALAPLRGLRPALTASLRAASAWFGGMADPRTRRLHYCFEPGENRYRDANSPIRDCGTAGDLAVLQRALGEPAFDDVISTTLRHFEGLAVVHADAAEPWCHLDSAGLKERSSIAHSAMLLLALAAWDRHPSAERRRELMAQLAAGILHQQRSDGSLRASLLVYFGREGRPDSGWQLYGGEAAFALARAHGQLRDPRLLGAAAHALAAYQAAYRRGAVDPDETVFFANWQQAAAAEVCARSADPAQRAWAATYACELQDDVAASGYYAEVATAPRQQATVEVACALEGLAHCLRASLAQAQAQAEEGAAPSGGSEESVAAPDERKRLEGYAECARVAVDFLLQAQVAPGPGVPQGAVGGFGHTLRPGAGQRLDVTGHVCCAFAALLELLEAAEGAAAGQAREP